MPAENALTAASSSKSVPSADIDMAADPPPKKRTPLPKLQIAILLYLQLAEPITSTVVYPFVNQLVREIGITGGNEHKTGYFAGLIVRDISTRLSPWCLGEIAGISLLCHGGVVCDALGKSLRSSGAETHSPLRSLRTDHIYGWVWSIEKVLDSHPESLRRRRSQWQHRSDKKYDGGNYRREQQGARIRVHAYYLGFGLHDWVSNLRTAIPHSHIY